MHAVCPQISKLTNISSADIIWSHFETTDSIVIARFKVDRFAE
jgi:hypothetical protein